jgi:enoyl-CoA hydratase
MLGPGSIDGECRMKNLVELTRGETSSRVAIVKMSRFEKRNALNDEMLSSLSGALNELRSDGSVKVVILHGGSFFSAGGDTSVLGEHDLDRLSTTARRGKRLCDELSEMPQIVIAAIEGGAIGGGISLAVSCDWRVMAEDAWIWAPEASMGLYFGWATLPRLAALVGPARAKWIGIAGRRHAAAECVNWGIADLVSPPGAALSTAIQLADEICDRPSCAVGLIKQSVNAAFAPSVMEDWEVEKTLTSLRDPERKGIRESPGTR